MKTKLTLLIILLSMFFIYEDINAQAPGWQWAKGAGGIGDDYGARIVVDNNNNSYIMGYFNRVSLTLGNITLINADTDIFNTTFDFFIAKYDPAGNILWAKSAGGLNDDMGYDIALDINQNIYVTGTFVSPLIDFDNITLTNMGGSDIFIVKYDAIGNVLSAQREGGSSDDLAYGLKIDTGNNLYLTGQFVSPSISFGSYNLYNVGFPDFFIVKYDPSGNVLWANGAGGPGYDRGENISVNINGDVYVTGSFSSPSIIFGTITLTNATISGGVGDLFIVKYDAMGNMIWANSAGGNGWDGISGIAIDLNGNLFMSGVFDGSSIVFGSTTLNNNSIMWHSDLFILKYDSSGFPLWAISAGGTYYDRASNIILDPNGNIYLCGSFGSPVITFGSTTLINAGNGGGSGIGLNDIFNLKCDSSGNVLWANSIGGTNEDFGNDIAMDSNGNLYITGIFKSPNISFGNTTLTNSNVNSLDIFIAKLSSTTGIADASTPLSMTSVYPNPATDYITIKTGSNKKQVITITDITGKIIYTTTTLSDKTIINTKDFSQGVYAAQVQAGDFIETKKVIVVR
ncbi:MAG: SBBP repeat-containing protein [Bacteroidia bacterium]